MDRCESSKRQRMSTSADAINQRSELDYINNLPDDILLLILDKLPMEEAMGTALISKRWKDLWKYKNKINLGFGWILKTGKKIIPSLLKFFSVHQETKIQHVSVSLQYDLCMHTEILSLLAYVSKKNVEELYIDFNDKNDSRKRWRRKYLSLFIPECELCACSSLIKLGLKFLQLETLPPLRFMALKELFLDQVKLDDDSVEEITMNCPSLEMLCLSNCNPAADLKVIIATGSNLVHLIIKEELTEVRNKTDLFIRAVNVKRIEFTSALPRKVYKLDETLECSESTFRLDQMHHSRQAMRVTCFGVRGNFSNNFLGLLSKFRAAKVLTMSSWCIQVLSIEVVRFLIPQTFEVKHLVLETGLKGWEFPGIAYMLLACHKLESLVIVLSAPAELNFKFMERVKYPGHNVRYPTILQDLTVVEFKNFSGNYQTWEDGMFDERLFFSGVEYGRLLMCNLKTYANNLRKLVFTTKKQRHETNQLPSSMYLSSYDHLMYCRLPYIYTNKR